MLKNYLIITLRNLYKHKFYTGINIVGLAVGLACCLLIMLYVTDELSYDRFHQRASEIYRLNWDFKWNNNEGIGSGTPPPLAATLSNELPEVQEVTRVYPVGDMIVRHEDKFFNETRIFGVDPNFFDLFSFRLIEGNPETVLQAPGSVILTEETARRYFGDKRAVGEVISIGEDSEFLGNPYSSTFKVTGIVENPPHNSHFDFDLLTSMSSHPQVEFFDWSWIWMQVVTYAVLQDGTNIDDLEARIVGIVASHAPKAFERVGFSYSDLIEGGGRWNFVFQPLTDVYLRSQAIGNRLGPIGNIDYLYIFMVVAGFILFIACINFMNLSTARSVSRAREVGVRKVLGSVRRNLVGQFMTEAVLLSLLAMLIAVGVTEALLVPFGGIAGKELELNLLQPPWLPVALLLFSLGIGFVSGSYPSFYLSAFRPLEVLKGKLTAGIKSRNFRNGLVVLQFAVSIALIICTFVVQRQMQFFNQVDVGFQREGVLVISNQNGRLGEQTETFRDILKGRPEILNASISSGVPPFSGFQDYYKVDGLGDEQVNLTSYLVDDYFIQTLGLELIEGRGFSKEFPSTAEGVILNESAVRQFGWEEPIGKTIHYPSWGTYTVIGVMKDFNFWTLHQPVQPFALFHRSTESYTIPESHVVVRMRLDDIPATLDMLETEWRSLAPGTPFEYTFLDDDLDAAYRAEQRLGRIFLIFAGLAIVIACLGLLGLAAFMAERRTKEIGVRKTLGASVSRVLAMLAADFTKWVVVANLLAWPIAWFAMDRWLQGFAYRVHLRLDIFIGAGILALGIALLTVSYQAVRAALANPVDSLRYE